MTQTNTTIPPNTGKMPVPPPGHDADWNAGFMAGVSAALAPVPNVPANADLVALLNAAVHGADFILTPGVTYQLNGTPTVKADAVAVNLNGASLALFPAPGATSDIMVKGANFELFGGTILRGVVVVRTYAAATYLHDLIVPAVNAAAGTGINTLLLCDVGGAEARVDRCTVGITNSVAIYWTADNISVTNSTFDGSAGEDVLRSDVDSNGKSPAGAIIRGCNVSNENNVYHKEAISIRMGQATIDANPSIRPYMRGGQSAGTKPGSNATVTITGNTFPDAVSPGGQPVSIKQGVIATIANNIFACDATTVCVGIDQGGKQLSTVTMTNNVRQLTAAGITPKHFWYPGPASATAATPGVTETGTTIVDPK